MINDPLGDMLIQIKNASMAGLPVVDLPYSKMKMAVAKILVKSGYLTGATKKGEIPKSMLHLTLTYKDKTPVVSGVKRVSKPGLRWYVGRREIPTVMGGLGTAIVSTPEGVMDGGEARKKGLGGELLCEIW